MNFSLMALSDIDAVYFFEALREFDKSAIVKR